MSSYRSFLFDGNIFLSVVTYIEIEGKAQKEGIFFVCPYSARYG